MLRKYYSARTVKQFLSNSNLEGNLHWSYLEALIRGFGPGGLGSAFFESVSEIVANRDVEAYLNLPNLFPLDPLSCKSRDEVSRFRDRYQVMSFLKKYPFTVDEHPVDRRQVAKSTLLACEQKCKETNDRVTGEDPPSWVPNAQRIIRDVLGDLTTPAIMKMITGGKHGPGATASSRGQRVTPYYKFMDFPYSVTQRASKYALAAISSDPSWMQILEASGRRREIPPFGCPQFQKEIMIFWDCVEVVESDRVTFVPKDARTERPIAVGASLNIYLQLGVKAYLEDKLKQAGVDLTDQSKNQELACAGSKFIGDGSSENQFSTIDLASASDSISKELVRLLLPSDWYAFLDDLRHDSGVIDGAVLSYEKFCAMGNGFTFPLESLLFYAIAKATAMTEGLPFSRSDFAIYGDDIIVRKKVVPALMQNLSWAGFEINSAKSFVSGPFKESCGKDYLHGIDVRPFFLKREVKTYDDVYFVCNSVARLCMSRHRSAGLLELYNRALSSVPRGDRIYLPLEDNSDLGLVVPFSTMSGLGLRPFLTSSEKSRLFSSRLLSEDTNLPYSWVPSVVAKAYSGRASTLLYLWLRGKNDTAPPDPWGAAAPSVGYVTRRKSTRRTIRIRPIPCWDGRYTPQQVSRHPFWDAE